MLNVIRYGLLCMLSIFVTAAFADEPANKAASTRVRILVMPYKLQGNLADGKINNQHAERLLFADQALRDNLAETQRYELVDEASSRTFSEKVDKAIANNACDRCEIAWAKAHNADQIIVPWVFRLSQLVLTMHFVILDAHTGKTILKKALDFRGDNDQSWGHAIRFFTHSIKNT